MHPIPDRNTRGAKRTNIYEQPLVTTFTRGGTRTLESIYVFPSSLKYMFVALVCLYCIVVMFLVFVCVTLYFISFMICSILTSGYTQTRAGTISRSGPTN